jgi:hypothetical protein
MTNHAGFGAQLAIILAQRLVSTLEVLPDSESKKELQGNLQYFDLAPVVQTLISSVQTGGMTLSSDKVVVAQLLFQNGNIYRATYAHHRNDEAVYHLFQAQPQGEFLFHSKGAKNVADGPDPGSTVPAMALMMDSIHLQNELKMLLEELPKDSTILSRNSDNLGWSEDEGQSDARQLWGCLHFPLSLGEFFERANSCHYHSARIWDRLVQTEQVKQSID